MDRLTHPCPVSKFKTVPVPNDPIRVRLVENKRVSDMQPHSRQYKTYKDRINKPNNREKYGKRTCLLCTQCPVLIIYIFDFFIGRKDLQNARCRNHEIKQTQPNNTNKWSNRTYYEEIN